MSALDWRKAKLAGQRTLSVKDEDEYRGADAAARWLTKREQKLPKPSPRKRKAR